MQVNPIYPFSAVVGQEQLKLALLLCAIDPGIGGVLIQGPRGMAKTTLARALSELVRGPFVELPLGATEERVTGSLNLDRALRDGRVEFAPGLLARAHDGVLYVDEVNLLSDALVDVLLDAAATGQNVIERDGVSHAHLARFVLVGSMNPDEGELRPQLIDRFGLSVSAEARIPPRERAQIVTRRLEFERAPEKFRDEYSREQRALNERCARARERIREIPLLGPALEHVSERCYAEGVEGVRADLAMLRAARAHAAWHERGEITREDVDAVAELALAHRRKPRADSEPDRGGSQGPTGGGPKAPTAETSSGAGNGARSSQPVPGEAGNGERGAMPARPVRAAPPPTLPEWLTPGARSGSGRRQGRARLRLPAGARATGSAARGAIDWFATLSSGPPSRRELRYRARRGPAGELVILLVDCSSSMLRSGGLAAAKAVARALALRARRTGTEFALISFRGSSAKLELGARREGTDLASAIAQLGAGGGTPLRKAMLLAHALCRRTRFSVPGMNRRLFLLSDGRS
ncbi:MAG TPA: ATP-binding protein, partial [Polyangiaceae bacterium]|nr:ATP-binding protein [Polyangiaceae bacterium]